MILFTSKQIQDKVTEMAHAIDLKHTVDDNVVTLNRWTKTEGSA